MDSVQFKEVGINSKGLSIWADEKSCCMRGAEDDTSGGR